MKEVVKDVEARLGEVEAYLAFLRELERAPRSIRERFPSAPRSHAVLKASTFLILYNVVESCVRSSLSRTYEELLASGCVYQSSTQKVKALWIRQQMDVPTDSANHQTYMNVASSLAQAIADGKVVDLDSRRLPISGNLDADAVRALCSKHGISLKVSRWAKGGAELETIKDQRNALAHGHKSFSECGRDYGVADLVRICKQTRHFLLGFMRSVEAFNLRRGYRV